MKPNPVKKSKSVKAFGLQHADGSLYPYAYATKARAKEEHPFGIMTGSIVVPVLIITLPIKSVRRKK